MDKPRVKPLEWEEDPRAGWKRGRIVGLSPTAKQEATIFRVESGWQYKGDVCLTAHDGLDAALDRAKAAAQADYEACVLAALEPVTVQDAALVLLKRWTAGEFEDSADAVADDAITEQWAHVDRTFPDAGKVIEAWLRALAEIKNPAG